MFLALAITCDEYFVPSLEKICEVDVVIGGSRSPTEFTNEQNSKLCLLCAEIRSE